MKGRDLHPSAASLLRFCLLLIGLYLPFAVGYAVTAAVGASAILALLHSGALSLVLALGGALLLDLEFCAQGK